MKATAPFVFDRRSKHSMAIIKSAVIMAKARRKGGFSAAGLHPTSVDWKAGFDGRSLGCWFELVSKEGEFVRSSSSPSIRLAGVFCDAISISGEVGSRFIGRTGHAAWSNGVSRSSKNCVK